ncbi:hypothetical protein A3A66_00665 [Microgenomates group bacterium RIFCSPLOWO2_01_FULL_46_13]|nr:MAG: hypothetical protein A2783_02740 [Microgenomates group bacterium RIFCSPHIGHO2_01_FULL_45_11]OGV94522.1 MAG: hypothetical protein A3A66_00665 [Microgenomates group bacterium RIFCSPLOWO2_01_FULL_46_13]
MVILHIITHYFPVVYGAENFAQQLAEQQAKEHTVHVVTGRWRSWWRKTQHYNGVLIHRTRVIKLRYLQTILATIPFLLQSRYILKGDSTATVHTHIYPGMIVGAFLKILVPNIYLVATIQGGDIGDYDEVFGPFKTQAKIVISWALNRADKVHCVSVNLKKQLALMGVKKNKIVVIPNGINVDYRQRVNLSRITSKRTIRFISTSRLENKNNLEELIYILSQRRRQKPRITLDIYGSGSLEKKLKLLIQKLRLTEQIKIKPYLSQNKLKRLLSRYDGFIRLPKQEGFGISFIEAMASGLITIGAVSGGVPEIIFHGKTGYLIDLKRPIRSQFQDIIKQRNHWQTIALAGQNEVIKKFSWQLVYGRMKFLYKD